MQPTPQARPPRADSLEIVNPPSCPPSGAQAPAGETQGIQTVPIPDVTISDLILKEQALARTTPPNTTPGHYRATDSLLTFLEGL
jgi:hypothetical protein